ncbi:uncharacterized protein LOC107626859 isoform X1 [Arachis ipaensis]|uniref:DUF4218 domain-containing protein n=2 Tax=Arachis TaxID=3817 RepID=A0A445AQD0_ARAHY|nr:uncharacterized protein LOC107626859 isoform X1 [Arachis ipaensis]RYR28647.1 hypothetical protein Ahy_B01g052782 [Arachis hypogaea]
MHIEKNICDNILYTLLNEKSKTKDNLNARKDLQDMGIRRDLWPDDNGKYHLALYSLTRDAKKVFLATLKNVRVPDGYSSNISRCIDEAQQKIIGLKIHDCHILIEQLLPLAIRNVLPNQVTSVLIEFCSFFRILCGKSLSRTELDKLQDRIVITLCHLEMLFPPSFFTVMVHLTVHLVEEAKLGGPVHYRYMYPIERELGHLKSFVRNKAHPEGSIAEGYLAEESLTFCSRYIDDMETRFNRPSRLCYDPPYEMSSVLPKLGTPHGGHSNFNLTKIEKLQAHRYVVFNREGVKPYINAFRDHIRRTSKGRRLSPTEIEKKVNKYFVDWFQALSVNPDNPYEMSTDIKFLARGPMMNARRFSVYDINGYRFRTLTREFGLKTQNSGVFLVSNTPCIASIADRNMRQANLPYYDKLEDIIELNYHGQFSVVLFKCKWADNTRDRGYKKDHWNFNCVNFDRLIHTGEREEYEPYIEAS